MTLAVIKAGGRLSGHAFFRPSPGFKASRTNPTEPTLLMPHLTHACIAVTSQQSWLIFQEESNSGRSERPPGESVIGIQALECCLLSVDALLTAASNCISLS